MVDIANWYTDINQTTPQIDLVHGISTTKIDRQVWVYKVYLPEAGYSGAKNILWTSPWVSSYTPSTTEILPISSVAGVIWNYQWEISPTWWVIIPEDWTYMVTARWIFQPISNDITVIPPATKSSVTIAQFWQVALLWFISYATSETGTKQFVWYSSKRFDLWNDVMDTTFSSDFKKWEVLWLQVAHKWDWVTFPVNWVVLITKLS